MFMEWCSVLYQFWATRDALLKRLNALVKSTNAVYQDGQLAVLAYRSPEMVVSLVQRSALRDRRRPWDVPAL